MSNDHNKAEQPEADEPQADKTPDTDELTDAELDQVAGAGYPQGEGAPIDLGKWGIGG